MDPCAPNADIDRAAELAVQSGEVLEVSGVVRRRPAPGNANLQELAFEASDLSDETLRLTFERSSRDDTLSWALLFLVGLSFCLFWLAIVLGVV